MQPLIRTARVTGLWYLGLAISGMLGFLLIRSQLFVADDPAGTLAHVLERQPLARAGIALELATVATQALAALWFYRLFRSVDSFAAGCLAVFGLINAVLILTSAAFLATALNVALDPALAPAGDAAATTQLLYVLVGDVWAVGKLFFGLWLIPMGWLVLRSRWMPRPLGWLLIVGGVGYVLSAFVGYLVAGAGVVADAMTYPATAAELWIVGYLLVLGIRRTEPAAS